jgi:hypothetical protein
LNVTRQQSERIEILPVTSPRFLHRPVRTSSTSLFKKARGEQFLFPVSKNLTHAFCDLFIREAVAHLLITFSGLAKVAIYTTNVDAENQTLINHKCVCGALNRHFCQTRVSCSFLFIIRVYKILSIQSFVPNVGYNNTTKN